MIDALILIGAGGIIVVLSIIAYIGIADSNRQARLKDAARRDAERAEAQNADLSEALERTRLLYNKMLAERNELAARNTALVEAMEAKPTQPKRTVRKNSAQATEQEG